MKHPMATAAGVATGIAAAVILLSATSLLDGVVDPNKGFGRLLSIFSAGFILVLSGGLGIAAYRYVRDRAAN